MQRYQPTQVLVSVPEMQRYRPTQVLVCTFSLAPLTFDCSESNTLLCPDWLPSYMWTSPPTPTGLWLIDPTTPTSCAPRLTYGPPIPLLVVCHWLMAPPTCSCAPHLKYWPPTASFVPIVVLPCLSPYDHCHSPVDCSSPLPQRRIIASERNRIARE